MGLRGEAGLIGAGTVIWLALLGLVIYICAAAFGADTAQFGSVPVPGQGTVELREGAIDVYYAEGVDPDAGIPLVVPTDLNYVVRDPQGDVVPDDSQGDESKSTDDGLARRIGELQVPEDGTYTVEAESSDAQQRITPELTFGEDPFAALKHRFSRRRRCVQGAARDPRPARPADPGLHSPLPAGEAALLLQGLIGRPTAGVFRGT